MKINLGLISLALKAKTNSYAKTPVKISFPIFTRLNQDKISKTIQLSHLGAGLAAPWLITLLDYATTIIYYPNNRVLFLSPYSGI